MAELAVLISDTCLEEVSFIVGPVVAMQQEEERRCLLIFAVPNIGDWSDEPGGAA
jgi:hypothetical protein